MLKLTPDDRAKLANACSILTAKLTPGKAPEPLAAADWRSIIADLLEQVGPILLAILISFLRDTTTTQQTKT